MRTIDVSAIWKAGFLFWADQMILWGVGRPVGLDFLGFIALWMVAVQFIRVQKSPILWCSIGIAMLLGLRYLIAPELRGLGVNYPKVLASWVFGTAGVEGVSYLPNPWMVYPLLGFIIGTLVARQYARFQIIKWRIAAYLLLLASAVLIVADIIVANGGTLFRWGTVSAGFFVCSIAVILVSFALSIAVNHLTITKLKSSISLNGVASLSVVPIHYSVIGLVAQHLGGSIGVYQFYFFLFLVQVVSFILAHWIARASKKMATYKGEYYITPGLLILAVSLSVYLFPDSPFRWDGKPSIILTNLGLLLLILLFGLQKTYR